MKSIAVLAGIIVLALPSIARADVRTLAFDDPQDTQATVSGVQSGPDIQRVEVSYDTAGSLHMVTRFYNPVADNDYSAGRYKWFGDFTLGKVNPQPTMTYRSCDSLASGYFNVHYTRGGGVVQEMSITNLAGKIPLTVSTSSDGRVITVDASSPGLANLDLQCFKLQEWYRQAASASNPNSNYDSGCDCWYIGGFQDALGTDPYFASDLAYFPGYDPGPLEQCRDGIDNDGNGDSDFPYDSTGCSSSMDPIEQSPQCSDGKDNDGDGKVDYNYGDGDKDCSSELDNSEASAKKPVKKPTKSTSKPKTVTLSATRAKSKAVAALRKTYGRSYSKRNRSHLTCRRKAKLRYWCNGYFHFGSFTSTSRHWRVGDVYVTRRANGSYKVQVRMKAYRTLDV